MLRVAITRALPEAEATAERLRALGAEPVLAPLLRIEARDFDPDVSGAQALLFTSANGVRAFASRNSRSDLRALCVGDATAEEARRVGFAHVRSADNDGNALALLAAAELEPSAGRVIHISGAHVASDLIAALGAFGFTADRRIAYEAIAAETLPDALRGQLDIVLFHSARAAETFVRLGAPNSAQLSAACMSAAVADAAKAVPWKRVIVPPRPREDALIAAAMMPAS